MQGTGERAIFGAMTRLSPASSAFPRGALLAALLLCITLIRPPPAAAAKACPSWQQFPRPGLLWLVVGPDGRRGFLFGTMHSNHSGVVAFADEVSPWLNEASAFVMETRLTPEAAETLGEAMRLPPGGDLQTLIGPGLYARARTAYRRRGWPAALLDHEKPWAVVLTLSGPQASGPVLDQVLAERAARRGLPVTGLESTKEQVAVLDHLPLPAQKALLAETLASDEQANTRRLEAAYEQDDLRSLLHLARRDDHGADALVYRRLLHDRNRRMARRLLRILQDSTPFIAVGALHLPGLLTRLHQQGYCPQPLWRRAAAVAPRTNP